MSQPFTSSRNWSVLAGALTCLSTAAFAQQSLVQTNGTTLTYPGDAVPDKLGVNLPGYAFGGTGGFDTPSLDDSGNLFFRGQMQEAGLTPITDRAYFYGSTRANLKMIMQGGDQAPGLATGVLLRTLSGSASALQSSAIRVSPNGTLWWGSNTYDGTVSGNYLFGGPASGAQGPFEWQGNAAPGTTETFAQTFQGLSQQSSGLNRNGHLYFSATLTGPTTERFGLYEGLPGALTLVQRSGHPSNAIPGTFVNDSGSPFANTIQINDANQVLYETTLSTVLGTPPATLFTDRAYLIYTPGAGSSVVVRESDTFLPNGFTFNALASGTSWTIGQASNSFTRSGKTLFFSDTVGGDTTGANDRAGFLYDYNAGVPSLRMVVRKGDAAPCTDTTWASWNNTSSALNDKGQICLQGNLNLSAGTTTANDTGFWAGYPDALQLVAREGQVMPGTGGGTAGSLSGVSMSYNDQGRVLFTCTVVGGTSPGGTYFLWDPNHGLMPLVRPNDVVEVAPSVFRTLTGGISTNTANNGDGQALRFGPNGFIGFNASIATIDGGGRAPMTVYLPPNPVATPFCLGDGTQGICPCTTNNSTAPGNGCGSSFSAAGSHLEVGGMASIGADSLTLTATNVPSASLFIQSDTTGFAILGDGILCATGGIIRLGVVFAVDGCATYQAGGPLLPISVQGGVVSPTTKHYQCWYRTFPGLCSPQNSNLSQGQSVVWGL